jgi:hypothetical protein
VHVAANLTISGTVTDDGQAATKLLLLNVVVTLWRDDAAVSHVYEADLASGAGGRFAWTINVRSGVEDDFTISGSPGSGAGQAGGKIAVDITAYVPGAEAFVNGILDPSQTTRDAFESIDGLILELNAHSAAVRGHDHGGKADDHPRTRGRGQRAGGQGR